MAIIFIDTNIYLRFYDSSKPELRKLLPAIKELKDSIFITGQIVDEVNRNKLKLICDILDGYREKIKIAKDTIPIHFDTEENKDASEWNKKKRETY